MSGGFGGRRGLGYDGMNYWFGSEEKFGRHRRGVGTSCENFTFKILLGVANGKRSEDTREGKKTKCKRLSFNNSSSVQTL